MTCKSWLPTTLSLLSLVPTVALAAPPAADDDLRALVRDLSAEITSLRDRQIQLQSRLDAAEAKAAAAEAPHPAAGTAVAAPAPSAAPAPAPTPGAFQVPGTNMTLRIGGYVKLDVIDDLAGTNANGTTIDFATIQIKGTPQASRKGQLSVTARQSRLFVDTRAPTAYGELKTYIEGDFEGANGNALETNSATFRLRHLYGSLGPVLAGQTWSNFYDIEAAPETIEFGGPVGVAYSIRQAQVRYTTPVGASGRLSVAIENPEGDFFGADHGTFGTNGTASSARVLNQVPDVTARYVLAMPWGRFSVAGVARDINLDTGGSALPFQGPAGSFTFRGRANTWGGGGVMTAQFPTVGKDSLTLWAVGGPGVGRYLQQAQDAAVNVGQAPNGLANASPGDGAVLDQRGSLHPITSFGGNVWYRHYWTDEIRSNITYGLTRHQNPLTYLPPNTVSQEQSLHVNLMWSPVPRTNFGVEYVWGKVNLNGQTPANRPLGYGTDGPMSRIQFGAQYSF
ncbi:MAG: hypothetical protein F8N37_25000 [Telmatospirillum sp.]|nr:hypothetical protein [Telmatospirillum sp.]